jgi:hypothetical protein
MNNKRKNVKKILFALAALFFLLTSCRLYEYGKLGGADESAAVFPGEEEFETIMSAMSGVWYSHYAGIGRLDGYRIGKWQSFGELVADSGKAALFPLYTADTAETYTTESGSSAPRNKDYFVFYDDTVFGQKDDSTGGNGGWDGLSTRYIGIVRAVNIFNGDPDRGALIIEYLRGCAPQWDGDIKNGQRPFFGIYYRVLEPDIVQMANAVNLEALYRGKKYYTETAHLEEAITLNTVTSEAEFISWGVVIPQNRE